MMTLVADVGGTQSRLGLVKNGILHQSTVRKFANADFSSFYEVVEQYMFDASLLNIENSVIALAGPIVSGRGSFTNLDWVISVEELKQATGCRNASLINDLTSLGYCIGKLLKTSIQHISGPITEIDHNNQYLVIGLGTGFNVCPVYDEGANHPICLQVEAGHTSLPSAVKTVLVQYVPDTTVNTVEELFSGRGLENLYFEISGTLRKQGHNIVQDHLKNTDPFSTQTLELFTKLLGLQTRELVLQYLPAAGVYFAGSVSRGVFGVGMKKAFESTLLGQDHFLENLDNFPIKLITDDAAGLVGCGVKSLVL